MYVREVLTDAVDGFKIQGHHLQEIKPGFATVTKSTKILKSLFFVNLTDYYKLVKSVPYFPTRILKLVKIMKSVNRLIR